MGAHLDRATVLFVRDSIHPRVRVGVRIASRRPGAGPIWIDHLQIHGAHPPIRGRADLYSGDDHHADARHPDVDRNGAADGSTL